MPTARETLVQLSDIFSELPPARKIEGARGEIARRLAESCEQLVVVDDDPTGTQTVHGVRVYMEWSAPTLRQALTSGRPVSFISANTRALDPEQAERLAREIGESIRTACRLEQMKTVVASRSDSTLRGHFPAEVESLLGGLGWDCDGVIIAPAFFEAGRYTVGDVHWVDQSGLAVPAGDTEFARDPTFGYRSSNLREWVEEKTGGRFRAEDVRSVSIEDIRLGGPGAVEEALLAAADSRPVVVNAACYEDLEVFVLGLIAAESRGKRFIYRCAAPFVKARGGIVDRPLLTAVEIGASGGPGLVVVGSYVGKTTGQLEALLASGSCEGIELSVPDVLDGGSREREISRVVALTEELLRSKRSAAVYTSREVADGPGGFLDKGRVIMSGLCEVVSRLSVRPSFVLAKGGITSMEVARLGLGVSGAEVLGQILPGTPVWRLGPECKWPGIPYVVFPGNVGDDEAVLNAVRILEAQG